jgi:hypothetical protein
MSTTSQHLGLKINDGSDPFLRADFTQNYNTLDQYPGVWICTSTTRPTWGAGQTGMLIQETDTRRTMLWTGTTWRELLTGPAVWWGSTRPGVYLGSSTQVTYVVGTFTVNRPGSLLGITTTELALPTRGYISTNVRVMIDGADANFDGPNVYGEYAGTNWPNTSTFGTGQWGMTVPSLGVRNISAGTHSIGIRVATNSSATAQLRVTSIRALAMFVNGTDR